MIWTLCNGTASFVASITTTLEEKLKHALYSGKSYLFYKFPRHIGELSPFMSHLSKMWWHTLLGMLIYDLLFQLLLANVCVWVCAVQCVEWKKKASHILLSQRRGHLCLVSRLILICCLEESTPVIFTWLFVV